MKVVQRDLDAVNYLHRSGSTTIGFKGTTLLPLAKGEAKVTSERGGIHIEARFQGLTPANGFGREYLTYVLWAIYARWPAEQSRRGIAGGHEEQHRCDDGAAVFRDDRDG